MNVSYALLIEKSLGNSLKRDLLALNARGSFASSRGSECDRDCANETSAIAGQ